MHHGNFDRDQRVDATLNDLQRDAAGGNGCAWPSRCASLADP